MGMGKTAEEGSRFSDETWKSARKAAEAERVIGGEMQNMVRFQNPRP
jgi:hypothetical protein